MSKPDFEERKDKAWCQAMLYKKPEESIQYVKELIKDNFPDYEVLIKEWPKNPRDTEYYDEIKNEYKLNDMGNIIWIKFTDYGQVAVVGAGKDISNNKDVNNGKSTATKLLRFLHMDYYKENVLIIPVPGIDSKGHHTRERNAVERKIGDFLIEKGVPVIDYYSHK